MKAEGENMSRYAPPKMLSIEEISSEDFWAYEELRREGAVNMVSPEVRELCGFDKDTHYSIMHHYAVLRQREGIS